MEIQNFLKANGVSHYEIKKIIDVFSDFETKKYFDKLQKIEKINNLIGKILIIPIIISLFFGLYLKNNYGVSNFSNLLISFFPIFGFFGLLLFIIKIFFIDLDKEKKLKESLIKIKKLYIINDNGNKASFIVPGNKLKKRFSSSYIFRDDMGEYFYQSYSYLKQSFNYYKKYIAFDTNLKNFELDLYNYKNLDQEFLDIFGNDFFDKFKSFRKINFYYFEKNIYLSYRTNDNNSYTKIEDFLNFYIDFSSGLELIKIFENKLLEHKNFKNINLR